MNSDPKSKTPKSDDSLLEELEFFKNLHGQSEKLKNECLARDENQLKLLILLAGGIVYLHAELAAQEYSYASLISAPAFYVLIIFFILGSIFATISHWPHKAGALSDEWSDHLPKLKKYCESRSEDYEILMRQDIRAHYIDVAKMNTSFVDLKKDHQTRCKKSIVICLVAAIILAGGLMLGRLVLEKDPKFSNQEGHVCSYEFGRKTGRIRNSEEIL